MPDQIHTTLLETEIATQSLASRMAAVAKPGDCFLLSGDIGAGKSTFARAFIRARLGNPAEDVPSPTFTLVQTYEHDLGDIWHCDLYRTTTPDECMELGLDDAMANAICLIEWPDKLGDYTPHAPIQITLMAKADGHHATITLPAAAAPRLEPALA